MDEYRWKAGGDVLKAFAAALLLILSAPAQAGDARTAQAVDRWSIHIREASARFGIPEEWIRRVMRAESGGRTTLDGRPITSHAGAMGLMQVMPGTYEELRYVHGLGGDAYDPRDNIMAGTAYLREMYDLYGSPGFLGAYNAGP
ncbi:MAG TPA: lytic transglycosylase domain-containing protein, partial [Allosphingosinicella sp.]